MSIINQLIIREAKEDDLQELLKLLMHLHGNPFPEINTHIKNIWQEIITDANHHVLLGFVGEALVTSCIIVVIKNLTRGQRPYALIENVITHPDHRKRGYASIVLGAAKDIAVNADCYKIMLMTSSKKDSTQGFYRRAGYNSIDKTAFIQWL